MSDTQQSFLTNIIGCFHEDHSVQYCEYCDVYKRSECKELFNEHGYEPIYGEEGDYDWLKDHEEKTEQEDFSGSCVCGRSFDSKVKMKEHLTEMHGVYFNDQDEVIALPLDFHGRGD